MPAVYPLVRTLEARVDLLSCVSSGFADGQHNRYYYSRFMCIELSAFLPIFCSAHLPEKKALAAMFISASPLSSFPPRSVPLYPENRVPCAMFLFSKWGSPHPDVQSGARISSPNRLLLLARRGPFR